MFARKESSEAAPRRRKLLALLLCLGIFCFGLIAGSMGTVCWQRSHYAAKHTSSHERDALSSNRGREMFVQQLDRLLTLTPEQKERIGQVVDRTRVRFIPIILSELKTFSDALERELTPEQVILWRAEVERFKKKNFTESSAVVDPPVGKGSGAAFE